jgi:hypothetical protein
MPKSSRVLPAILSSDHGANAGVILGGHGGGGDGLKSLSSIGKSTNMLGDWL